MPAVVRPRASEEKYTSWDRARLSVVVPIGVIVAVAIVCIVVAVLSSAQRADDVAVQHEKQLFTRALSSYGERVLREVKSVAAADQAVQNLRVKYDPVWAQQRVGLWLKTYFDHDYVFIFDGNDHPIFSQFGRDALDASWADRRWPIWSRSSPICAGAIRPRTARSASPNRTGPATARMRRPR